MTILPKGTVVFDGVSKRYRLGVSGTLRDAVSGLLGRNGRNEGHTLWALRDVSFRVEPGGTLGLIGPNGAGKTTTLKLLSRITRPTTGRIAVGGRLSSLIELGAGFHPELTGRENIYLNGAILGLKRAELKRKFDEIVAFSELERFIDTPVKRYSSGMYVRLGFAVAAHVEPDVLLVDEVLAVGDSPFRQKCMTRMEALRANGTTLLFVSHNMYQVRRLCDQALLLIQGKAAFLGPTGDAILAYEELTQGSKGHGSDALIQAEDIGGIVVTEVGLHNSEGKPTTTFRYDQPVEVRARYCASDPVIDPIVKMRLVRSDGIVVAMVASRHMADFQWKLTGTGTICARFDPIQLATGRYAVEVRIIDSSDSAVLASGQSKHFLVHGPQMPHEMDTGSFVPHVVWRHQVEQEEMY
jgi:lipopolysaccharide transport system ATP-binding protein